VDRLPPEDRDAYVRQVAARLPEPVIDYVRLNVLATRS
jgi:trans-aconitate 2-methyltransferase